MSSQGPVQFQVVKISPVVKAIVITNLVVLVVLQIILEKYILSTPYISTFFSLNPSLVIQNFMVWQVGTYMFLHDAGSILHIFFNMFSLWLFGSELESRWGGKAFLTYYLVSGAGAAVIYLVGVVLVGLVSGSEPTVFRTPVLGASGAVFGVFVAYGILFGDRMIYFFGVFPMKAKLLIMIMAGMEILTLLGGGMGGGVANLAHLGGMVAGFVYLLAWTRFSQRRWRKTGKSKSRRNLRLVVNNDKDEDPDDPKYWN